jgi:hypothetical protein
LTFGNHDACLFPVYRPLQQPPPEARYNCTLCGRVKPHLQTERQ